MEQLRLNTLITEKEIKKRVAELGQEITEKYADKELVALCILKGSFIFYADLIREINTDLSCEFLGVSSYHGQMSTSGEVKLTLDVANPIQNKHILIIEDIVDSGLTMNYLINNLKSRGPESLNTVCLLHKPEAAKVETQVDYKGFEISNEFVVGYGLDYQGYYRNLPYIAQVQNIN